MSQKRDEWSREKVGSRQRRKANEMRDQVKPESNKGLAGLNQFIFKLSIGLLFGLIAKQAESKQAFH